MFVSICSLKADRTFQSGVEWKIKRLRRIQPLVIPRTIKQYWHLTGTSETRQLIECARASQSIDRKNIYIACKIGWKESHYGIVALYYFTNVIFIYKDLHVATQSTGKFIVL